MPRSSEPVKERAARSRAKSNAARQKVPVPAASGANQVTGEVQLVCVSVVRVFRLRMLSARSSKTDPTIQNNKLHPGGCRARNEHAKSETSVSSQA